MGYSGLVIIARSGDTRLDELAADPSGRTVEFRLSEEIIRILCADGGDDFEPLNSQAVAGLLVWADKAGLAASPDRLTAALEESPVPSATEFSPSPRPSASRNSRNSRKAPRPWTRDADPLSVSRATKSSVGVSSARSTAGASGGHGPGRSIGDRGRSRNLWSHQDRRGAAMTMYGSAPRGTHAAEKVLVGLAAVVVLAAAVVVWRSASGDAADAGDADPAAAPTAAADPAPLSAAPSTVPAPEVSSAPAEFSTGSWLVSLGGESGGHLTIDGDYAALSTGQRTAFTVVKGLADASCFSIRASNGKYLRHYDFRLRFDKPDDAELYRKDATFCPLDDVPAGTVRLRSVNYPERVIHRRGNGLYLDKRDDSDAFEADSSLTVERA